MNIVSTMAMDNHVVAVPAALQPLAVTDFYQAMEPSTWPKSTPAHQAQRWYCGRQIPNDRAWPVQQFVACRF